MQIRVAKPIVCALALAAAGALAGDIYRWTDNEGRTHTSGSVPGKYRDRAQRLDATPNEAPCQKAWREYRESQACYAPFRTANGGMKEEAVSRCGPPVADPNPRCGPAP